MNKICIKVEYYNMLNECDYHSTTYELFASVKKAYEFAKTQKVAKIDLVIANNTYYESDGSLNYDDYSDTILEKIDIQAEKDIKRYYRELNREAEE